MPINQNSFDQADILRKRMEDNHLIVEEKEDVLVKNTDLPPRSEVHRKKDKKKTKLRIRYPIVRLLVIIFVLIVCLMASYNLWKGHLQPVQSERSSGTSLENSNVDVIEMQEKGSQVKEEIIMPQTEVDKPKETTEPLDNKTNNFNSIQSENSQDSVESPTIDQRPADNTQTAEEIAPKPVRKYVTHKVKPGETLYRVSMKYYKSRAGEEAIKKANGLDANGTIFVGQHLKIPLQ